MAMMAFEQARRLVLEAAAAQPMSAESVAVFDSLGRVLAEDVHAPFDVPGHPHAAMDGYAIVGSGELTLPKRFRVVGRTLAGDLPFRALAPDETIAIATGAVVPPGAARVVPVEIAQRLDDEHVALRIDAEAPRHIRAADEDFAEGALALRRGERIGWAGLGVLSSFGRVDVCVARRPRVAVLVTGSELVPAGLPRRPGQIHDSNTASLHGLLRAEGIDTRRMPPVVDDPALLREALLRASAESDLVISSGGASAGQVDHMPRLLAELGEVLIWKVAMRPGMPVLFGRIGTTLVMALPGNPVAVVAGFLALVRPLLRQLQSTALPPLVHARLDADAEKLHDRLEFRRASLRIDEQGVVRARLHPNLSSGALRSVLESDALVLLAAERRQWRAGDVVEVLCYC